MNLINSIKYKARKLFYGNDESKKIADIFLKLKVQSPYDKTQTVVMIDLLASTAMTEASIISVANSYGIHLPSQGIDISGHHALEYLLYHGKKFQYISYSDTGEKIFHGIEKIGELDFASQTIPLITGSHLDKIAEAFSYSSENWNSFYGQAVEFAVKDRLTDLGYEARIPISRNTEGYDLIVGKKFFDDHNLTYTEHPDIEGFGLLQVKSTSNIIPTKGFTYNTELHFLNNPEIPVIASSKIVDSLPDHLNDRVISFEDISLGEGGVENYIFSQYSALKDILGEDIIEKFGIKTGLDASQFHEILDNGLTSNIDYLSDIGLNHIPTLGIFITASISAFKNVRKYKNGQIDRIQGIKNFSYDVTKTAIIGTSTIVAGTALTSALGTSTQESFNGAVESLADGFDLEDLKDLGEFALIIGAFIGIGYLAKLAWNKIIGDPLDQYKKLQENRCVLSQKVFEHCLQIQEDIIAHATPHQYKELHEEKNKLTESLKTYSDSYKILPLSYYVRKHKIDILSDILKELGTNIEILKSYFTRTLKLSELVLDTDNGSFEKHSFRQRILDLYPQDNNCAYDSIQTTVKNLKKKNDFTTFIRTMITAETSRFLPFLRTLNNDDLNTLINDLDKCLNDIKDEEKNLQDKGILLKS